MRRAWALTIAIGLVTLASAAHADSSVVGRSDRNRFGRWEWVPYPRLAIGIGTSTHMFAIGDVSASSTRNTTPSTTVSVPGDLLRGNTVVAQTIDLRPLIVHLGGPFYIGPLVQIGPGFRSGTTNEAGYSPASSGIFFEGGLLPGLSFQLGDAPVTVRLEALLGGRVLAFSGTTSDQRGFSAAATSWVAQPRVALDMWTSPFVTIGAFAGTNLVHQSDYVFGLSFAAHLAPFDATP